MISGWSPRAEPSPARRDADGLADDWFLTAAERDNPDTTLDSRHPDGRSWTTGNSVTPLVHGVHVLPALLGGARRAVRGTG